MTRTAFYSALLALLMGSSAFACGILEKENPQAGSVTARPVDDITLTFSEPFVPTSGTLELLDAKGHKIPADANTDGDTLLSAKVSTLPPGKYKVKWTAVWKDCGMKATGSYKFTVRGL